MTHRTSIDMWHRLDTWTVFWN